MRKTLTVRYPTSPERVATMLADEGFQRSRVAGLPQASTTVETATPAGGLEARISGSVPARSLPPAVSRFIKGPVSFRLRESWGAPTATGARTGQMDVLLKGAPVSVKATTAMRGTGTDTVVRFEVSLSVKVPIVGGRLEAKALSMVDQVVADEERRAAAWLADH